MKIFVAAGYLTFLVCTPVRSVNALATSQEETGARIMLHCMHLCETAPNTAIFNLVFDLLTLACWFRFFKT